MRFLLLFAAALGGVAVPASAAPAPRFWCAIAPEPTLRLPDPPPRSAAQIWSRARPVDGDERAGYVSFTFDDGPSRSTTPAILEALAAHDVPGAFFVVGRRLVGDSDHARERRALLVEMAAAGHAIGNHTHGHERLRDLGAETSRAAIDDSAAVIAGVLGGPPLLFRAPYGVLDAEAAALVRARGYTRVGWNIDPSDYRPQDPQALRQRVVEAIFARGGGVVLLHDTKAWTSAAMAGILADVERENCARIAAGGEPIVPASLHYFLRDASGQARPVPAEVAARTRLRRQRLIERCRED